MCIGGDLYEPSLRFRLRNCSHLNTIHTGYYTKHMIHKVQNRELTDYNKKQNMQYINFLFIVSGGATTIRWHNR